MPPEICIIFLDPIIVMSLVAVVARSFIQYDQAELYLTIEARDD